VLLNVIIPKLAEGQTEPVIITDEDIFIRLSDLELYEPYRELQSRLTTARKVISQFVHPTRPMTPAQREVLDAWLAMENE